MVWYFFVWYKNVLWHNLKLRYVARQVSECVGNFGLLFGPSELAWSSNLKTLNFVYNPVACISYFAPSSGRKRRRYDRPTKTGLSWLHGCHLCTKTKTKSINGVWIGSISRAATEIVHILLQQAFCFSCSHYHSYTNTWSAHGYCWISTQKQKKLLLPHAQITRFVPSDATQYQRGPHMCCISVTVWSGESRVIASVRSKNQTVGGG